MRRQDMQVLYGRNRGPGLSDELKHIHHEMITVYMPALPVISSRVCRTIWTLVFFTRAPKVGLGSIVDTVKRITKGSEKRKVDDGWRNKAVRTGDLQRE